MRHFLLAGLASVMLVSSVAVAYAQNGGGNGAPSGPHYNLNIIGVPRDKTAEMTGSSGHTIFVPLSGQCRINLSIGDYRVLDRNCTDGPAAFQLPNPDPDNDGLTAYSVYARALGRPGGSSTTTTCFDDAQTGETYCSTENVVLVRDSGRSTFDNVSRELLTVCVDWDRNGSCDQRLGLFDDSLDQYFWQYDNRGLRVAQLRFYPIPTNVGTTP